MQSDKIVAESVGLAVRGAIAQAGLTQEEAAPRVGIPLSTLSRRINGLIPFTFPELVRVAAVTGVTLAELVSSAERIAASRMDAA